MADIRLDSKLVAQGYDRNKNGKIEDDLKIGTTGVKTVDQLADALATDQVVISDGVIEKRAPGKPQDLPEIRTLRSVNQIAHQALGYGSAQYPSWNYQYSRDTGRKDQYGEPIYETAYRWGEAISDQRARLEAIETVTRNATDSTSKAIYSVAHTALQQYTWDRFLDNGTSQSRYVALHAAAQSIASMSVAPGEPATVVQGMFGRVEAGKGAIGGLQTTLANPATKGAVERAKDAAEKERAEAKAVPLWQKILIFGLFKSSSHNKAAKRYDEQAQALQQADPAKLRDQLAEGARDAYEVSQDSWTARDIEDARRLQDEANPVNGRLDQIKGTAQRQNEQISDLLKRLGEQK